MNDGHYENPLDKVIEEMKNNVNVVDQIAAINVKIAALEKENEEIKRENKSLRKDIKAVAKSLRKTRSLLSALYFGFNMDMKEIEKMLKSPKSEKKESDV